MIVNIKLLSILTKNLETLRAVWHLLARLQIFLRVNPADFLVEILQYFLLTVLAAVQLCNKEKSENLQLRTCCLATNSWYEGHPGRQSLGLQARLVVELLAFSASGAGLDTGEIQAGNK